MVTGELISRMVTGKQVAYYKKPEASVPSYIQVVGDIPKSPSEKYLDRVLRDQFSEDADNVYGAP